MICEQCNKNAKPIFELTLLKKTGKVRAVKVSTCKKCLQNLGSEWLKFFIDELTNKDEKIRKKIARLKAKI